VLNCEGAGKRAESLHETQIEKRRLPRLSSDDVAVRHSVVTGGAKWPWLDPPSPFFAAGAPRTPQRGALSCPARIFLALNYILLRAPFSNPSFASSVCLSSRPGLSRRVSQAKPISCPRGANGCMRSLSGHSPEDGRTREALQPPWQSSHPSFPADRRDVGQPPLSLVHHRRRSLIQSRSLAPP
jgi:hypothetical protein